LYINSVTPPDEVQKMIDERSGMQAVGSLDSFLKYKAAKAMGDAAKAEGGGAGTVAASGMGLGVGAGLGMMLPGMLMKSMEEGSKATPSEKRLQCPKCHSDMPFEARFCPSCGTQILKVNKCLHCGKDLPLEANFCMVCGAKVEKTNIICSKCGTKALPGAVFCNQCGEKIS
ncbi:MAG TPA: zinc-ribbon domain-containing protein, partial [Thermodesulfobacteriota bacterium]|nr:zinc-ribbon domain-containing protein [Thermodesulfobacteriota bacterium]